MINSNILNETYRKHMVQYGINAAVNDTTIKVFFMEDKEYKSSHDHKFIFSNVGTIKQGDIITTLNSRWLCIAQPFNVNNIYDKILVREIKFGFRWGDIAIPCVMDGISSTVETSSSINVPYNSMDITIQETEENKSIAINDILFVANKKYCVEGIDNSKRGVITLFVTTQAFSAGDVKIWNALEDVEEPIDPINPDPEEPIEPDPPIEEPTIRFSTNVADAIITIKFINGEEDGIKGYDPTGRPIFGKVPTYAEVSLTTNTEGYAEVLLSELQALQDDLFPVTQYDYIVVKEGYRDFEGVILVSDINIETGIDVDITLDKIPSLLFNVSSETIAVDNATIIMKVETSEGVFTELNYTTDIDGFVEVPIEVLEALETDYAITEYKYTILKEGYISYSGTILKADLLTTDVNIPIELAVVPVVDSKSIRFNLIGNTDGLVLANANLDVKVKISDTEYSTISLITDTEGNASVNVADIEVLENAEYPITYYEYQVTKVGYMNYIGYINKSDIIDLGIDVNVDILQEIQTIRFRVIDSITRKGIPYPTVIFYEDKSTSPRQEISFTGDKNGYVECATTEIDAVVTAYDTRYRWDALADGYTVMANKSISKSNVGTTGYSYSAISLEAIV